MLSQKIKGSTWYPRADWAAAALIHLPRTKKCVRDWERDIDWISQVDREPFHPNKFWTQKTHFSQLARIEFVVKVKDVDDDVRVWYFDWSPRERIMIVFTPNMLSNWYCGLWTDYAGDWLAVTNTCYTDYGLGEGSKYPGQYITGPAHRFIKKIIFNSQFYIYSNSSRSFGPLSHQVVEESFDFYRRWIS